MQQAQKQLMLSKQREEDAKLIRSSRSMIKTSVRKLAPLANLIRGMKASEAILQMRFSNKKLGKVLEEIIFSAVSNAENNFNVSSDSLVIKEVKIGKHRMLRRVMPRARGRSARIYKHYSRVEVLLSPLFES